MSSYTKARQRAARRHKRHPAGRLVLPLVRCTLCGARHPIARLGLCTRCAWEAAWTSGS